MFLVALRLQQQSQTLAMDPVKEYLSWNVEAIERCAVLAPQGQTAAHVRIMVHSSTPQQANTGASGLCCAAAHSALLCCTKWIMAVSLYIQRVVHIADGEVSPCGFVHAYTWLHASPCKQLSPHTLADVLVTTTLLRHP